MQFPYSLVTWISVVASLCKAVRFQDRLKPVVPTMSERHKGKFKLLQEKLIADSIRAPPNRWTPDIPVKLNVTMTLASLLFLETKQEMLGVSVWFEISWQDKSLSWDMKEHPFNVMAVGPDQMWRPVLAIANSVKRRDQMIRTRLPLEVYSDGTVVWYPGNSLTVDCHADIQYFPFDVQSCAVRVAQWIGSEREANCTAAAFVLGTLGNSQWEIVDKAVIRYTSHADNDSVHWWLDFRVTVKRHWELYACAFLFPLVLVSGLNCVIFLLPVQCGEKMSVSVTTFLILAFFMAIVQQSLPDNSDHICYLAVYLSTQLTIGAMSVALTAVQVNFYHKDVIQGGYIPELSTTTLSQSSSLSMSRLPSSVTPPSFYPEEEMEEKEDDDEEENEESESETESSKTDADKETTESETKQKPEPKAKRKSIRKRIGPFLRVLRHFVADMDFYCFPIFLFLNLTSFISYTVVIAKGPSFKYPS